MKKQVLAFVASVLFTMAIPSSAYAATSESGAINDNLSYSSTYVDYLVPNTILRTEDVDYTTRIVKDSDLPEGVKLTVQKGKKGVRTFYKMSELSKDQEGNTTTIPLYKDEITVLPTEEVIRVGTNTEVINGISNKTKQLEAQKAAEKAKKAAEESAAKAAATAQVSDLSGLTSFVASQEASGGVTSPAENRAYAESVLSASEFQCADRLAIKESGWNTTATNSSSGAYGVPQSLPGNKMASAGSDWMTNGKTQFNWMISYVNGRYGSFCNALSFHNSNNYY